MDTKQYNRLAQNKFMKENKDKVYRKRAIKRIEEGKTVSLETLKKFDISVNEFNSLRKKNGYDTVTFYDETVESTKAVVAEINRKKYYEKALQEETKIAQSVKTSQVKLKDIHDSLDREPTNPSSAAISDALVEQIQVDGKLTFTAIREYFKTQIGKPKFSITTFNKVFGTKDNGTGVINTVLNLVNVKPDDIVNGLLSKSKNTSQKILNADVSKGTKKSYFEAIWTIMHGFPNIIADYKLEKHDSLFEAEWRSIKGEAESDFIQRQQTESVDPFSDIKAKILKKYKFGTQEYLYINLYDELPCRDDFGDVMLIEDKEELNKDFISKTGKYYGFQNVMYWNGEVGNKVELVIYLMVYKTFKLYGTIKHTVSQKLASQIIDDILNKPRDFLFIRKAIYNKLKEKDNTVGEESIYTDGRMTQFVKDMLVASGIKETTNSKGGSHNKGSINLLRHAKISEFHMKKPQASPEEKADLAKQFNHSPVTSLTYIRKVGIDKLSSDEIEKRMKFD